MRFDAHCNSIQLGDVRARHSYIFCYNHSTADIQTIKRFEAIFNKFKSVSRRIECITLFLCAGRLECMIKRKNCSSRMLNLIGMRLGLQNHNAANTGECFRDNEIIYVITHGHPMNKLPLPSIRSQTHDPNNTNAKATKTKLAKRHEVWGIFFTLKRHGEKKVQLVNSIQCILSLLPDGCLAPDPSIIKEHLRIIDFAEDFQLNGVTTE